APVSDIQNEIPVTGTFTGNNNSSCTGCGGSSTQSMFSYNEAASGTQDVGYVNFPSSSNTETFQEGVGYTIYVRGNILSSALWDLSGVVNQGSATIPVSFTSTGSLANDGWNMVGNPYPSTIDWNASSGWTKAGLDGSIYIRDNGQTTPVFATWNGTTGTNGGSQYISTGQGFWVKAISTPTLIATENVKVAGTQTTFIRQASPQNILRITMKNSVNRDETVIHLRTDATEAFDSRVDAWKLTNATFNLSSVLSDGTKLAINSLPLVSCPRSVRLDVTSSTGTYKLEFSQFDSFAADVTLTLTDNFLNKSIDMRTAGSYDFQVTSDSKSYGSNRFVVSFGCIANVPSVVTGIDDEPSILTVYPNPTNGQLYVEFPSAYNVRSVKMFSNFGVELGEVLLNEDNGTKKGTFDMSSLSSGLYFVRAYHAGKILNIKVSKE
ncbi:MAG TPA: T9SS type A sorting domain-containing protein, partial [Cyclobacteriaceae bacterium]